MIIDISPAPHDGLTPICFCAGTRIATPEGTRASENIMAGDMVLDIDGKIVEVLGTGARTIDLLRPMSTDLHARLRPVRIAAHAFGPNWPNRELGLSPQHRILISGSTTQLMFGLEAVLVPAKAFIGSLAAQDHSTRSVTYHHLLCDRHCVIRSNGLATESLLLAGAGMRMLTPDDIEEINLIFPGLFDRSGDTTMEPAFPILTVREGRAAAHSVAGAGSGAAS